MLKRFFLDKCNTIFYQSEENFGLYPVIMLSYGKNVSRGLIHFDILPLKKLIDEKVFPDASKIKYTLKMTNCASIDNKSLGNLIRTKGESDLVRRAASFELLLFKLPKTWDRGIGFDSYFDFWEVGHSALSLEGSNWFQASNGNGWCNYDKDQECRCANDEVPTSCDGGIYTTDVISKEYDKWAKWMIEGEGENPSIIVGRQHFDYGNENLEIDVTDYVNGLLASAEEYSKHFPEERQKEKVIDYLNRYNHGLGIMFTPLVEDLAKNETQYVGFFTDNTNTIFHPIIEANYDDAIIDDRFAFYQNKQNRLYLYVRNDDGNLTNLDEIPTCSIEGYNGTLTVKQQTKGVYYTTLTLSSQEVAKNTIMYDTWSNLKINGVELENEENEFVVLSSKKLLSFDDKFDNKETITPTIFGINDSEKLNMGEKRMVHIIFQKAFTHTDYRIPKDCEYRIYVKDGTDEIDIIGWDKIHRGYRSNFFLIDTESLLPAEYHIDIKVKYGNELKVHKNELTFKIVGNKTNLKK